MPVTMLVTPTAIPAISAIFFPPDNVLFSSTNLSLPVAGRDVEFTGPGGVGAAVGAAVGEQISTVRLRRTEYRHYTGQCGFGAGAHVHRLGGQPDVVDADHRNSSRNRARH